MEGMTVCYHHGGKTPKGIAAPSFKHGRYSKHLPQPLATKHEANLAAIAALKKNDEGISLLDARICELCERLQTGERGTIWDDLLDLIHDAQAPDPETGATMSAQDILARLEPIADKGKETEQAWRDLDAAIHSKAKITAIEAKRMADAGEIATRDEVKTLVLQIVNVVRDHVQDPAQLRGISKDLSTVLHGRRQAIPHAEPVQSAETAEPAESTLTDSQPSE